MCNRSLVHVCHPNHVHQDMGASLVQLGADLNVKIEDIGFISDAVRVTKCHQPALLQLASQKVDQPSHFRAYESGLKIEWQESPLFADPNCTFAL